MHESAQCRPTSRPLRGTSVSLDGGPFALAVCKHVCMHACMEARGLRTPVVSGLSGAPVCIGRSGPCGQALGTHACMHTSRHLEGTSAWVTFARFLGAWQLESVLPWVLASPVPHRSEGVHPFGGVLWGLRCLQERVTSSQAVACMHACFVPRYRT